MTVPQDPTRSGPPVGPNATRLSLPEIEALCLKAARGAGFSWGLAEEAGFAARFLAARGLPGPEVLLRLLDGRAEDSSAPVIGTDRVWRGGQCPIATGAALSDFAGLPQGPAQGPIVLETLAQPLLILPFACLAARLGKSALQVTWPGFDASVQAGGIILGLTEELQANVATVRVEVSPALGVFPPLTDGRTLTAAVWAGLDAYALRTTVPSSAASRAGAGAGGSDND